MTPMQLGEKLTEAGQELNLNVALVAKTLMDAGTPNAKQLAEDLINSLDVFVTTIETGLRIIEKNLNERNN